jgi:hypothetical protein
MKMLLFSILVTLSVAAFATDSKKIEIPGYVINALSDPGREDFWMSYTKPLELSQYALTNESLSHPIILTILHYTNTEDGKKAFELSWRSRPKAPDDLKIARWDAAHSWQTGYRSQRDMCLLKKNYVVCVYDLPSDLSVSKTDKLLEVLADTIADTKPKGPANGRQPSDSITTNAP